MNTEKDSLLLLLRQLEKMGLEVEMRKAERYDIKKLTNYFLDRVESTDYDVEDKLPISVVKMYNKLVDQLDSINSRQEYESNYFNSPTQEQMRMPVQEQTKAPVKNKRNFLEGRIKRNFCFEQ